MKICTACVLPETFPGISFNPQGVCNFCESQSSGKDFVLNLQNLKHELDQTIGDLKGRYEYDCILAFSGGKDSTYTLMRLVKDYGLRTLAITIDNGFLSDQAIKNCHAVTANLGVDFQLFCPSPNFMQNMYFKSAVDSSLHSPAAIKRASSICNSCINLINNFMMKTALQQNIPMIVGGYIAGQVPKDSAVLKLDLARHSKLKETASNKYMQTFGGDAKRFFSLPASTIETSAIKQVHVLNPMLCWGVSEKTIFDEIETLGWKKSTDTGLNSTNCRLNDVGVYFHYQKWGFHPYVMEIAEQVRNGLMSREEGLRRVSKIPIAKDISDRAKQIGLSTNE